MTGESGQVLQKVQLVATNQAASRLQVQVFQIPEFIELIPEIVRHMIPSTAANGIAEPRNAIPGMGLDQVLEGLDDTMLAEIR